MSATIELARHEPAAGHTSNPLKQPVRRPSPRWMDWVPKAAIAWASAYGSVRIWWAIRGAPSVPPPQRTDLIAFSGWGAVALCAIAGSIAVALGRARWRRVLLFAAWGVSAALFATSALLLLDVVGVLFPGQGVQVRLVPLLSRAAALTMGVLLGATAEAYRRRWRSACLFCGRTADRVELAQPPRWAWWGAYMAIAGCLIRLGAQMAVGVSELQGGGWSLLGFEAGFLLAGTALPMALVQEWGRVVPRWVPLLAGRHVPRWLLLGPAGALACGMTAYFGFTLVKVAVETFTGAWEMGADDLPLAFFWVAVPAYLTWGIGLGAASLGYYRVTRPRCRVCGR